MSDDVTTKRYVYLDGDDIVSMRRALYSLYTRCHQALYDDC